MPNVKVGVAWRRDGKDVAHQNDLLALRALKDVEVYSVIWEGAKYAIELNKAGIEEIDVLVVPGGPHANDTQVSLTQKTASKAAPDKDALYASERATSELNLIERARYLGMPILAICGGSWRLLENYKGKTIELGSLTDDGKIPPKPEAENKDLTSRHTGNMNLVGSEFKHAATIQPGTMLQGAVNDTGSSASKVPVNIQVNSVHWAVAYEGATMGKLPQGQYYPGIDPRNQLQVNARDSGGAKTVEGFESVSGAPVMGLQWHPEYMTPGGAGKRENALQTSSRQVNLAAMQYVIDAGAAYRVRRNAVKIIQGNIKDLEKTTAIAEVQFRREDEAAPKMKLTAPPKLPGETKLPGPTEMAMGEYFVRKYLGALGGKRWQLKSDEWQNLLDGQALSAVNENTPDYKKLGAKIAVDKWLARFLTASDLEKAKQATAPAKTWAAMVKST